MKLEDQYIIRFAGLKEGRHKFSFSCEKKFFDDYPVLEANNGNIKIEVSLDKSANMLTMHMNMNGFLEIQCDRCLDIFQFPVLYQSDLVVKFGEQDAGNSEELWVLDRNEHELDLKHYFFECIGLCLPIQRIHPQNPDGTATCNMEMLNLLETHKSKKADDQVEDPRWKKLKDLLNNN